MTEKPSKSSITLNNISITGAKTGIASDGVDINAKNIRFDNVQQPYDLKNCNTSIDGSKVVNEPDLNRVRPTSGGARTGWTSEGPSLPASCNDCGSIFPSRNFKLRTMRIYVKNHLETCPICRSEDAKVNDGLYAIAIKTIELLSDPNVTESTRRELAGISNDFLNGKITKNSAAKGFISALPSLVSIFKEHPITNTSIFIGFLSTILTFYQFAFPDTTKLDNQWKTEIILKQISDQQIIISNKLQKNDDDENYDIGEKTDANTERKEPEIDVVIRFDTDNIGP